jgi:flavin reductase (DIM6/NTAB) family NADH-FMN oxidoreductase RutF
MNEIEGLKKALSDEMTPKFLATRSADGIPNVVPVTSLMPSGDEEDLLIFGNFLLRKSVRNLDQDPRVGILVITAGLECWVLQGDFAGWQRKGAYVDRLNNTDLLRYNAYTGIRSAGVIQAGPVLSHFRISKLRVLADYLLARVEAARVKSSAGPAAIRDEGPGTGARGEARSVAKPEETSVLPRPVWERLGLMMAVRVLAFLDGKGCPLAVPVLSLQPAGESMLVCAEGISAEFIEPLPIGDPVAASLLTLDVVSFQTKGLWLGSRRFLGAPMGAMSVNAVYAGGPPIPGRKIA